MKLHQYIRRTLIENVSRISGELADHYNVNWMDKDIGTMLGTLQVCPETDEMFFSVDGTWAYNDRGRSILAGPNVNTYECACCNENYLESVDSYTSQDGEVCESCYSDYYVTCIVCDEVVRGDNAHCEDGDDYTCRSCQRRNANVIDGYHSRANESKRMSWRNSQYRNNLLFGIELEILSNRDQNDLAYIANAAKSHGFLAERDGSLDSNYGVEIVAPPLTIEECAEQWGKFLNSIHGYARGWQAGTGYGMHVSFSRKPLTNLHAGKLLQFVHHNQTLCESVAGRSANEWCRYRNKGIGVGAYETNYEKYEALALRGNYRWEMRIFRSTLKVAGFMRNVEFVKACIDFTKQARAGANTTDFEKWLFLPANRKQYPNLFDNIFSHYRAVNEMKLQRHQNKLKIAEVNKTAEAISNIKI